MCVCDLVTSKLRQPVPDLRCCIAVKERTFYLVSSADHAAVRCISLQSPAPSIPWGPNLPQHPVLEHPQPIFFPTVQTKFHTHSICTTGSYCIRCVFRQPTTRQDPERTIPDIPTVSRVPSCFVVALRIAGVVPQYLNWHLAVLRCVHKTRVMSCAWVVAGCAGCGCVCACVAG